MKLISWHLQQILDGKRGLKALPKERVVFHEVTKKAVLEAISNPRAISQELVDAQQTRRALDYLVGFQPVTFVVEKIRRGLCWSCAKPCFAPDLRA